MKGLSFNIDPAARWSEQESKPATILNMLPPRWRPLQIAPTQSEFMGHNFTQTGAQHTCPHPLQRNLFEARRACASFTVRRTHQILYGAYRISTTQNGNGLWIAAFGRYETKADGQTNILETDTQTAEVIALADAQIAIDDQNSA